MRACHRRPVSGAGRRGAALLLACGSLWTFASQGAVEPAGSCEALAALRIQNVGLTGAEPVLDALPPAVTGQAAPLALPVPVCRVTGIARPSRASRIRFELMIPLGAAWNGKYLQLGSGGFAGRIPYHDFAAPLARGYAVGASDGGHVGTDFTDGRWAMNAPEAVRDFGHRAVKSTRDAAGALLRAFGGGEPRRAYFVGCSNGGREALQAAQRYPRDFSGIVAGAPASHMTALFAFHGRIAQRLASAGGALPASKLPALQRAAIAACGNGDGIVADPAQCAFDPASLACATDDAMRDDCLTTDEIETARAIYAGVADPRTGRVLRGPAPGAEAEPGGWAGWLLGDGDDPAAESGGRAFSRNFYAYFVRKDPAFDIAGLTARDVAAGHARFGRIIDATDPDLRAFAAGGGRLIQYHGWNDPGIPADMSIAYFQSVQRRMGDTSKFYRLFMVPGMLHCGGGPGAGEVDWLAALEDWVERDIAPQALVAHRRQGAAAGPASQTLRPYSP